MYPDPTLTPGATNPNITQANIANTICDPNWSTKTIRPPASYTNNLKQQQLGAARYVDKTPSHYEEDHLISWSSDVLPETGLSFGPLALASLRVWHSTIGPVPKSGREELFTCMF